MASIIGACTFSIAIAVSVLNLCGLPFGEFTMGGRYSVIPKKLKLALAIQLLLQVFFVIYLLQMGGFVALWFSNRAKKVLGIAMAIYLSLNTVMNFLSKSKKEKYVMTPISLITVACFWIVSLQM